MYLEILTSSFLNYERKRNQMLLHNFLVWKQIWTKSSHFVDVELFLGLWRAMVMFNFNLLVIPLTILFCLLIGSPSICWERINKWERRQIGDKINEGLATFQNEKISFHIYVIYFIILVNFTFHLNVVKEYIIGK